MEKIKINNSLRDPDIQKKYVDWLKNNKDKPCGFCSMPLNQIVRKYKDFIVVKNVFPYRSWFDFKISSHLMIVPKRHIKNVSQLSKTETEEYIKILGEFDKKGFSSYTKSEKDPARSIEHFHTHLLKIEA